jgi:uncharacterized protein YggE
MTSVPIVSVRGEATIEVDPEVAVVSVGVVARGPDYQQTLDLLSQRSRAVTEIISGFASGIAKSETTGLHVYPELSDSKSERVRRYSGQTTTTVTVDDFAVLSELIVRTSGIELVQISGPWWQLRPTSEAYRAARLAAAKDAVVRAREYADAFGVQITGLFEIADQGMSGSNPVMAKFAARSVSAGMQDSATSFDLQPARQQVTGQVEARFTITQPDLATHFG